MGLTLRKTNVHSYRLSHEKFDILIKPMNSKTYNFYFKLKDTTENCIIPEGIHYGINDGSQYYGFDGNGAFVTEPGTTLFYNKVPIVIITKGNGLTISENIKVEPHYW